MKMIVRAKVCCIKTTPKSAVCSKKLLSCTLRCKCLRKCYCTSLVILSYQTIISGNWHCCWVFKCIYCSFDFGLNCPFTTLGQHFLSVCSACCHLSIRVLVSLSCLSSSLFSSCSLWKASSCLLASSSLFLSWSSRRASSPSTSSISSFNCLNFSSDSSLSCSTNTDKESTSACRKKRKKKKGKESVIAFSDSTLKTKKRMFHVRQNHLCDLFFCQFRSKTSIFSLEVNLSLFLISFKLL